MSTNARIRLTGRWPASYRSRMSRVAVATLATFALLGAFAPDAEARAATQTIRLEPRDDYVGRPSVLVAEYVKRRDGDDVRRMVRWNMDDGSVWLSPTPDCQGRRHYACKEAWRKAAKRAAFFPR